MVGVAYFFFLGAPAFRTPLPRRMRLTFGLFQSYPLGGGHLIAIEIIHKKAPEGTGNKHEQMRISAYCIATTLCYLKFSC